MVPDVGAMNLPGAPQMNSEARHKGTESEGVRGLKSLGVRDLHHRMAFLACSVQVRCNVFMYRVMFGVGGLGHPLGKYLPIGMYLFPCFRLQIKVLTRILLIRAQVKKRLHRSSKSACLLPNGTLSIK